MKDDQNEDQLLREVTLQNSKAIFSARQRAEEDLVRTKEALQRKTAELASSLALTRATLESTTDGILVTDAARNVTDFNEKFVTMWGIPRETLEASTHRQLLNITSRNFQDPEQFVARISDIYASSPPESYDLLELADGRVFERFSRIQFVEGRNVGRVWSFRDITERRRAEEALRTQSEWLRVTLASIGDAVMTTDTEDRVLSLNGVAQTLTGWTQQEARGHPLTEILRIVHEETRQPVTNPAAQALSEGRVVGLANHTILIGKDGKETPIDDSAAPIRDDEGRIRGAVLVFRGIAERKQAEEAVRRSERELAEFFENATIGLHWVGPDGTILRVNRAELEMLGYNRDEYLGHNIAEFHADEDAAANLMHRLNQGETVKNYEARMRCKDGAIKHVVIDSSVLWQNGQFIHTRCFTRDITDRKRVEEAQARLAAIVQSSQDAIIGKTLDSRILSWNAGAERLFAYTAEEVIGQPVTILIPTDRQDEERGIIERLRRGERIESYETVRLSKQGRPIDVSLVISPIRDPAGQVIGASTIARDITARKQAERALRRSEAQFRQLADALPQIVWTARPDGYVEYYNERWYEFTGFQRGEFGDQSWKPILHPDDLQRTVETYYGCIASGSLLQIEYRFKDRRTGGYRWYLGLAYPVREEHGRIVRWFGTCTDIDDTKRSEETTRFLAEASATLAELADYESTLQRVAALAVPSFADWCAVDMQDADGSLRRLAVTHSDPAKLQLAHEFARRYPPKPTDTHGVMKVLRSGESEWIPTIDDFVLVESAQDEEPLRIIRQLGLRSYICVPLRARDRTLGVITFVTAESGRTYDATDLAAAEDLAHRAVIAIDNANLLGALKDADRRKDEFLAMLAHELRNPLAPIQSAVELLPVIAPDEQGARDVIERQVQQLARLVDDLLDVSRISRGKIDLQKELVPISAIVNLALETSRPNIEANGHKFNVSQSAEPMYVEGDRTRLAQVLANLLNNAAKYTPRGGHIDFIIEPRDGWGVLCVRDDGIGIPSHMLSKVFEMFAQVETSRERASGGLGIGLTLVRRLLDLHGGTIEARSAGSNQGSEFIVRLPLATSTPSATVPQALAPNEQTGPTRRVLIVDDNVDAARMMATLLEMEGHEVQVTHDGMEALELAAKFQPDAAFIDLGLPKVSGHDVGRRIREQSWGKRMLLVAVTGWGQEDDRQRSKEAGFDAHLVKPVKSATLYTLLAELEGNKT